jgi:hypothetical protein
MKHIKTFESFLNEAESLGPNAKKAVGADRDEWNWYTDFEEGLDDDTLYQDAIKKLGIKPEDAIVIGGYAVDSWDNTMTRIKKSGVAYIEFEDEDAGEPAVIFSAKK